jgi:hypothetical protein
MQSTTIASLLTQSSTNLTHEGTEGVVEIGLLLPANRAAALLRLAKDRRESVGQVLRKLIERELAKPV